MLLNSTDSITPRHLRKLNADMPKSNKKYITDLHEKLTEHNIFYKAKIFSQSIEANHPEAESINTQLVNLSKSIEQSLPNPSSIPWSEQLHNSRITTKIIAYHITQLNKGKDMTTPINNLQSRLNYNYPVPATIDKSKQLLQTLKKQLRKNIKNAEQLRQQHLKSKLTSHILAQNNIKKQSFEK